MMIFQWFGKRKNKNGAEPVVPISSNEELDRMFRRALDDKRIPAGCYITYSELMRWCELTPVSALALVTHPIKLPREGGRLRLGTYLDRRTFTEYPVYWLSDDELTEGIGQ